MGGDASVIIHFGEWIGDIFDNSSDNNIFENFENISHSSRIILENSTDADEDSRDDNLKTFDNDINIDAHQDTNTNNDLDNISPDHQHVDIDDVDMDWKKNSRNSNNTINNKSRHWSFSNIYIFLVLWNFTMIALYTKSDYLTFIPTSVKIIIGLFHVSAILLYLYDVVTYLSNGLYSKLNIHVT